MNTNVSSQSYTPEMIAEVQRAFVTRVYFWMMLGLLVTAGAAMFTLTQQNLVMALVTNRLLFWGLLLIELALVWSLSGMIARLSVTTAMVGFIAYAALNGVTLSLIVLAYTLSSIATTFFITAGMFGAMSAFGYVTKRDLTAWGSLLMMALVGLILASVINIFFANSVIYWVTTFAGIVIFVGLTAYDTQKIKQMSLMVNDNGEVEQKGAIMGALALYLDFINLFLLLLRLFGRRR
ncbi:MAG: Bax inhibitor-1/YccA family protein [Chloroflexi bacterium]|nr:Bax inhibitor-1/YccA family protein [Chloroflexota bacterium]